MANEKIFNLDDFLKGLEDEATEKVAEDPKVEDPKVEEPKVGDPKSEDPKPDENLGDAEKVAALQEEGQIIARAFAKELEKLGVGDGPMTPNPEAIKDPNEVNHLSVGDIKLDQIGQVEALLKQLQAIARSGGGDLAYTFTPGAPAPKGTVDETVLAHDVDKAQKSQAAAASMNKAAAATIIDNLYKQFFSEKE